MLDSAFGTVAVGIGRMTPREVRDIVRILRAWGSTDDYGVDAIYVDTVQDLLALYALGTHTAAAIAAHGRHTHCPARCTVGASWRAVVRDGQ